VDTTGIGNRDGTADTREHHEVQQCPACDFDGISTGMIVSRAGNHHYDGSVTYRNRMVVGRFECSVCGLELVTETEVRATGLPTELEFRSHEYPEA
jgi:predicted RNA-binding Zn-ribbon protein involved in translation (DUF1610 family)